MYAVASLVAADFGPRHRRMGGRHPGLILLALALIAAAIVLAVIFVRNRRSSTPPSTPPSIGGWPSGPVPPTPATHAEAILSERFARGEVSVEEFYVARQALRGEWSPASTASTMAGSSTATMAPPSAPPMTTPETPEPAETTEP